MRARRCKIYVIYQGTDITEEISGDLLNLTYTDNATGWADDISLELKDNEKKWLERWRVQQNDTIEVYVELKDWMFEGDNKTLKCGKFNIDVPAYSGPPRVLTINGTSAPVNTNFTTPRDKVWEDITLEGIAGDVAQRIGYDLIFDSGRGRKYTSIEQKDTPDMDFLDKLCSSTGHGIKVADNQIIIYDEIAYEGKGVIEDYYESSHFLSSYALEDSRRSAGYGGVKVEYQESSDAQVIKASFHAPGVSSEKIYKMTEFVSSVADAEYMAKAKLRELNKKTATADLTIVGNPLLYAAGCLWLGDFGDYSGKYFIDKITHNLPEYSCDISAHKVLEGY